MRYTFECCSPGCEDREPGCHSYCERYKKERAKLDERNARERKYHTADDYMYDAIRKSLDNRARRRR